MARTFPVHRRTWCNNSVCSGADLRSCRLILKNLSSMIASRYNSGVVSHRNDSVSVTGFFNPPPSRIISSCKRDDILLKPQKNQNTWKWYVIKGSNQRNLSLHGDILIERFTSSFIIVIKANFNSNNVKLLSQTPPGVFSLKLECRLQWEVKFHLSPRRATVCLLSITSAGR